MKNPVAKYARKFNKSSVMKDRKKAMKKGDRKHKGTYEDAQQTDTSNRTNAAAKKPQNYTDKDGKQRTRMVPAHQDVQNEKLNPSMGIKAYIDDFQKSDAPQFQGKSAKKRREMAIAAYMDAKKGMNEDAEARARLKLKHAKEKENLKNRHTKEREAMKEEDVKENYRASRALSHASNKMYGRQHPEQDKPKTGVTKQAKSGKAAKADLFRALDKKYGDPKKKTGIYAKEETMDPRDYTDEPGHLVVVTKPNGKKSINYFHKTHAGAKKRADQINKRVRIPGHKATVHKTDGRKIHEGVEQFDEASQKLIKKMQDLAGGPDKMPRGAEFRALKKRAQDELKKDGAKKKAAPAPKTTTKTAKGKTHTGRADPADQNIFMQMRKAQDAAKASGAKMHTLKVGPKSTVSVPTSLVNKALAKHDSLKKPEDKRRLKIQLIKALRAKAK